MGDAHRSRYVRPSGAHGTRTDVGHNRLHPASTHARRKVVWVGVLFFLVLIMGFGALLVGAFDVSASEVWRILWHSNAASTQASGVGRTVVWDIRLPRIFLAVTVGAALATSGTIFQGCFRNPLVEPYILGVSSGAAFGAALGIVAPAFFLSVQMSAFVFGSLAVFGAYQLARVRGETPVVTLILAGVIISSVFSALVSILKYLSQDAALREIVFWLMGGLYFAAWSDVAIVTPVVTIGILASCLMAWKLNLLSMGDDEARSLGVRASQLRVIFIVLATLMTTIAVSSVGIIAWVGLMMPHATRMLMGPDHRFVLPASAALGAIYILVCDTAARTLTTAEIPIGILTSLVGAPYLFYLLRTKGQSLLG